MQFFEIIISFLFLAIANAGPNLRRVFKGPHDGYNVRQVHLAQGKTPDIMTVSWVTDISTSGGKSQVKYGRSSNDLSSIAEGVSTHYNYTFYSNPEYFSGIIHHVELSNLLPGTDYFYQCGDFSAQDMTSGVLRFRTLPKVGDHAPLSFGVLGDLGTTNDSQSTLRHIMKDTRLQLILHAGDLSYADCDAPMWDYYGEMIEDLSKERPWMVGPGNHEIELNQDGSTYLAFEQRYKMPQIKPAEIGKVTIQPDYDFVTGHPYCASSVFQSEYNYGNSFFSFESGPAHIVYLNPYSTTDENSVQYQWLVQDLAKVNREITPWLIIVMHCPWYNSNAAHHDEKQTVEMRNNMEELFYQNHVNLVITGHVHAYERTFPVYKNETVDDGVVYVTIGDAGNREGHATTYLERPSWSAFRNGTQYGHASLTLVDKEKLIWRWNRNVDDNIVSMDEMILCNSAFGKTLCSYSSI